MATGSQAGKTKYLAGSSGVNMTSSFEGVAISLDETAFTFVAGGNDATSVDTLWSAVSQTWDQLSSCGAGAAFYNTGTSSTTIGDDAEIECIVRGKLSLPIC